MSFPILLTDNIRKCTFPFDYGQFMVERRRHEVQLAIAAGLRHGLHRFGGSTVIGGFPSFTRTGGSVASMLGPAHHFNLPLATRYRSGSGAGGIREDLAADALPLPAPRMLRAGAEFRSGRFSAAPVHGVAVTPGIQPATTSTGPRLIKRRWAHTPGTE